MKIILMIKENLSAIQRIGVLMLISGFISVSVMAQMEIRQGLETTEHVYGRKDGMGLLLTQVKPTEKANGKAIIQVLAGSWFSSFRMIDGGITFSKMFLDHGYTVFLVVVGSQPRYAMMDQLADVKRAVRFIRYNANRFGVDPGRLGITGISAGGHLSLLVATADDISFGDINDPVDSVSSRVQAVAVLHPPTDLHNYGGPGVTTINNRSMQLLYKVYGAFDFRKWNDTTRTYDHVTDTAERNKIGRELSPINAVTPDDPPIMIIHGTADITVPL